MPITLAQAKVGMADKVDQQVVDTFRRSSLLLDRSVVPPCCLTDLLSTMQFPPAPAVPR